VIVEDAVYIADHAIFSPDRNFKTRQRDGTIPSSSGTAAKLGLLPLFARGST
jgi:hypothetical protein